MKSVFVHLVIISLLLALTQLTRPESTLIVSLDGSTISVSCQGTTVSGRFTTHGLLSLAARFRKGTAAETYISRLSVQEGSAEKIIHDKPGLYLWGRELTGQALRGNFPGFKRSFADWTSDIFHSDELPIDVVNQEGPLVLQLSVLGRGELNFTIAEQLFAGQGGKSVTVNFHDSTINNAIALSFSSGEVAVGTTTESPLINISRIANAALETILGGMILLMGVSCLSVFSSCGRRVSSLFCFWASQQSIRKVPPYRRLVLYLLPLAALHFVIVQYFARGILAGVPHVPDSAVYYRQAQTLATGRLCAQLPPGQPYEAFLTNGAAIINGELCYQHASHTWPALIAVFIKLGIPWLTSPTLSALGVLAAGVLAARFLGLIPALLGTLLIAICPFSIVMAGEYMMHGAVFGLLACGIACVVYSFDKRSVVAALLGGVLLCLAATMRQVTAVAVLFPWLVAVLVWQRKQIVSREGIAFLLGAVAVGSVFLLDCKQITGSYLSLPHSFLHGLQLSVQNLRVGVDNVESMIGWHLAPMLLSLPFVGVTLSLIGAGALVARRQFLFVLAAPFVLLAVAHFFVSVHGLHGYGARFLYEASPALLYLIAIFFEAVFCVSGLRGKVATVALFAVIVIENGRSVWAILPSYRDYNGLSNALATNLCSIPAAKAIVVMPAGGWQAADVASSCYDPTYSKRIFIEANEQSQWRSVVQSFSDWELYRVRGETVIREPMVPESKQ